MISELECNCIEERLNTDEYIVYKPSDFVITNKEALINATKKYFLILLSGGLVSYIFSDFINNENVINGISVFINILAIMFAIKTFRKYSVSNEFIQKASNIQKLVVEHNKKVYNNLMKSELNRHGINNFTREVSIYHFDFVKDESIGINDDEKYFAYYKFSLDYSTGKPVSNIKKFNYKDLIRYDLIDNSTTTQTATSITKSNAGKALGGAAIAGLLFNNATAGAIIGGSGQRKTETTFKTSVKNSYQIVIYLNSLEDPIITINTGSRNKVNEIISMLEYILRNQNS